MSRNYINQTILILLFSLISLRNGYSQNSACGEVVPSVYSECVSGEIPIFSSICDVTFSMFDYQVSPQSAICNMSGSTTNNQQYVAFIANGLENVNITVTPSNCTFSNFTSGIQAALLSSCNPEDAIGTCHTACPMINPITLVTYTIPTPGQVIYLMVDGCSWSTCDFVISFNSGVDLPEAEVPPTSQILGPSIACGEITLQVDPPFVDVCNYFWTLPDGTVLRSDVPEITFNIDAGMPAGQVCVTGSNDCNPDEIVPATPLCFDLVPGDIDYTIDVVQPTCGLNNGSIEVIVNNPNLPLHFQWSPATITGAGGVDLAPGTYNVTILDSYNCAEEISIVLNDSDPLLVDAAVVDIDCASTALGSVEINVNGGQSGNFSYQWSPNVSSGSSAMDLEPGTYSVTVTDIENANCNQEVTFEINPEGVLDVSTDVEHTLCELDNGSITVVPNGIGPYTYNWGNPALFTENTGMDLPVGSYSVTIVDATTGCTSHLDIPIDDSPPLEASVNRLNPDCSGGLGSATVSVTGGSGNYEYDWNPDISDQSSLIDLSSGTYTVTVTDVDIPGCETSVEFVLENEGELELNVDIQEILCGLDNGGISVDPKGVGPYDYMWSPSGGFTDGVGSDLSSGSYTVTVQDQTTGCRTIETIELEPSDELAASPNIVHATCSGNLGQVNINVTGGSGNYDYTWSPDVSSGASASDLEGGTYQVTITDNDIPGCDEVIDFVIQYSGDLPVTSTVTNTVCGLNNGRITVTPDGVGPYTYSWSNPAYFNENVGVDVPAGFYTVTITDLTTGCIRVENITVQNSPPLSAASTVVNANCDGTLGSIDLSVFNGTGSYNYVWDPAISTGSSAVDVPAGTYTVNIEDSSNSECKTTIVVNVIFEGTLPVEEVVLHTTCNLDNGSILLNPYGDGPFSYNWTGIPGLNDLFADGLAAGSYTVSVQDTENGCSSTLEISVEESDPLEAEGEVVHTLCALYNGSINIDVIGGSGGYNFEWDTPTGLGNTAYELGPGQYTITITDFADDACYDIVTVNVDDSPALEVVIESLTHTSCGWDNGEVTISINNGSGNYLILVDGVEVNATVLQNLTPGYHDIYVIDLDIDGCTGSAYFELDDSIGPDLSLLAGDQELCISSGLGEYYIENPVDGFVYNWMILQGSGNILSGQGTDQIEIQWGSGETTAVLCVETDTYCGFMPFVCIGIGLTDDPVIDLGGDKTVCGLSLNNNGTISHGAGNWEVVSGPGNLSFSNINNPAASIEADVYGQYTIRYSAGQSGCSSSEEITLNFISKPEVVVVEDCSGGSSYVLQITVSGGQAPYSISSGNVTGSFSGNVFTSDPIVSGAPYNLVIQDANGCETDAIVGQRECACDRDAGQMPTTTLRICIDEMVTAQHIDGTQSGDGETVYIYVLYSNQLNPSGSRIATSLTGQFSFDIGTMTAGTTYYIAYAATVLDQNGEYDFSDICTDYSNGQPVIWLDYPEAIIDALSSTCGTSANVAATGNFTEVEWFLVSGPGTGSFSPPVAINSIFSVSTSGEYTIGLHLSNGGICNDTVYHTIDFLPSDLAFSTTPEIVCNELGTMFQVSVELSGGSGSYLLVSGEPVGGNFMGMEFISFEIEEGENYTFSFTDTNGCDTITVSGLGNCDCLSRVGSITENNIQLCDGDDLTFTYDETGQVLDPNDVVMFILYEGTHTTINTIIATSTTPFFTFPSGITLGSTYFIRAVVGNDDGDGEVDLNDPCLASSISKQVLWRALPSGVIADVDPVCGRTVDLSLTGDFQTVSWSVVAGPGQGNFTPLTSAQTVFNVNAGGIYEVEANLISGTCTTTVTKLVEFLVSDFAITDWDAICAGDLTYEVVINLSGTAMPYTFLNGISSHDGVLTNNQFVSEAINSGEQFNFSFTDAAGCDTITLVQMINCDCETRVGSIVDQATELCEGEDFAFTYNDTNQVLDGDDVVQFILYEGTATQIDNILRLSSNPFFEYFDGLEKDKIYYVQALVGNNDGNGNVDDSDPCVARSISQTVVWYALPTGVLNVVSPTCGLSSQLSVSGNFDQVLWSVTGGPGNAVFQNAEDMTTTVTVTQVGVYQFQVVLIRGNNCQSILSGEVEFISSDISVSNRILICDETNTSVQVQFVLNGGSGEYILSDDSPMQGTITGNSFLSDNFPSGDVYEFYFTDSNGCDTIVVTGIADCNCETNVGEIVEDRIDLCYGEDLLFTYDSDVENLDGDDIVNFILYIGTPNTINTIVSTSNQPMFTFGATIVAGNTYYIQAFAGNNNGSGGVDLNDPCLSRSLAIPVVWNADPEVMVHVDGIITCTQLDILLSAEVVNSTGPFTYTWFDATNTEVGQGEQITVSIAGDYRVVVTNAMNCSGEAVGTVNVEDGLITDVFGSIKDPSCPGFNDGAFEITNVIGGAPPYQYSFNDGPFSDISRWENLTDGRYPVKVMDSNGCVTERTIPIDDPNALLVDLGSDITINEGEEINVTASISPDKELVMQYRWNYNNLVNIECEDCELFNYSPKTSGVLSLTVFDRNGCPADDRINVRIITIVEEDDVFIPNVFSPNFDGVNDYFELYNISNIDRVERFTIFDRWGSVLYHVEDVLPNSREAQWDGYIKGKLAAQGVYIYQIVARMIDGTERVFSGDVTLFR